MDSAGPAIPGDYKPDKQGGGGHRSWGVLLPLSLNTLLYHKHDAP